MIAEVLATPVSAYLMTFDPWFPYVLGIILLVLGTTPALFLPETLEDAKAKRSIITHGSDSGDSSETEPVNKTATQEVLRQMREFKESTKFIWRDSNVYLMVLVLFVSFMSRQSTNIIMQYASKKFDWSIARVRSPHPSLPNSFSHRYRPAFSFPSAESPRSPISSYLCPLCPGWLPNTLISMENSATTV